MRKDIKKSSYYVWFLGAQEAKGLRGLEYIAPVVRGLVEREREVEPFKVTLQVSHKGLKIVQNVPGTTAATGPAGKVLAKGGVGKPEVVKHLIPHHAVTCAHQQEDLVACILLLYNPVTKCPVHVHAYRCDSVETATVLHGQLRVLIERPDNQKKLGEIEARLTAKGLLLGAPQCPVRRRVAPPGSDGRSTRESESSGGSSSERLSGVGHQERIANLYDSLAAELREKLGSGGPQAHAPILLPPRDYDTVLRQKGNLSEINARRCLNTNVVGVNATTSGPEGAGVMKTPGTPGLGSGGSSGIGSDHAPSPDQDADARFLDNHSTSDEEWNTEPSKDSLFLVQGSSSRSQAVASWQGSSGELSLPRARRLNTSGFDSPTSPVLPDPKEAFRNCRVNKEEYFCRRSQSHKQVEEPSIHPDLMKLRKQHSVDSSSQHGSITPQPVSHRRRKNAEERQRSPSPTNAKSTVGSLTPRDRFNDAKEKFLSLEREKQEEQERQERALMNERRRMNHPMEPPISPSVMPVVRSRPKKSWSRSRDSEEDIEELSEHGYLPNNDYKYHNEREFIPALRREPSYSKSQSQGSIPDSEDYSLRQHGKPSLSYVNREEHHRKVNPSPSRRNIEGHGYRIPEDRGAPPIHQRYASPRREQSPDMKMRKERCTSPVMNSSRPISRKYPEECSLEEINSRYIGKIPRSHLNLNPVPFAENNSSIPLERYRSPTRVTSAPRPSPRHQRYPTPTSEEEDDRREYKHLIHQENRNYPPRGQYDNNDKKRRSMYESIEDERRRNSNELAKEFKRRSFQDHGSNVDMLCANSLGYQELDERERYPGLDRETARVHPPDEVVTSSPRYRHSYAEPFHQYQQPLEPHHEMLHRTNSSLSSGRVGMAAIHPY